MLRLRQDAGEPEKGRHGNSVTPFIEHDRTRRAAQWVKK